MPTPVIPIDQLQQQETIETRRRMACLHLLGALVWLALPILWARDTPSIAACDEWVHLTEVEPHQVALISGPASAVMTIVAIGLQRGRGWSRRNAMGIHMVLLGLAAYDVGIIVVDAVTGRTIYGPLVQTMMLPLTLFWAAVEGGPLSVLGGISFVSMLALLKRSIRECFLDDSPFQFSWPVTAVIVAFLLFYLLGIRLVFVFF